MDAEVEQIQDETSEETSEKGTGFSEKFRSAGEKIRSVAGRMSFKKAASDVTSDGTEGEKKARRPEEDPVPDYSIPLSPLNIETGLTDEQVKERVAAGRVNVVHRKGVRTTKEIIKAHTLTYFNILNLVLGFLVFLTGQYKNMLFMGVIVCNSCIGIFQELKVKQLIDKLSVITMTKVKVYRSRHVREIPIDEIVVDDVVRVAVGDQIVTDGKVLAGKGLEVNESMLTGESKPVKKKAGDPLLSGSFIVAGTGVMQVEKVGNECYASKLVDKASNRHRASSEMQNTIQKIIKVVSVAIIPIGLLLYRSQHAAAAATAAASGYSQQWVFARSVVRTVSGVIGMIPEGLVLLTSVSFIIGVGRLAYKRALVQEMESIEALARANILCTDKTGTITTGTLEVSQVVPLDHENQTQITEIIAHLNGAFSDSNVTQDAVNEYFGVVRGWEASETIPFSSERKYKGAAFPGHGNYLIGAPEYLAPGRKDILDQVDDFSRKGFRVLLLTEVGKLPEGNHTGENIAEKPVSVDEKKADASRPIALIVISDVIKEDARDTFDYFRKAGVQVKVISGDNPVTVSAVAVKAGVEGADKYVDATTLPDNPIALAQEITKYNVFGRVKPEQKQAFVKAWQKNGNTVAMVGDGVNDVLAIKDADCGIAMAKGSEAAKQAAHIVLLDSDFSSMKDIVSEGKTIISNIERVSALYLTKTIYSCILCLIFIFLQTSYPWTTLQMGLMNVVGIGMPSFLLTLEQNEDWHAEGFLKHVLKVCLPAAITMVITMMMVQVMNAIFHWPEDIYSYFNVMLGAVVSLLVVGQVCWPLNPYRKFVVTASLIVFAAAILLLPGFYDIHSVFTPWTFLIIPLSLLVMMLIYWVSRWTNQLTAKYEEDQELKKKVGLK